MNEAAGIRKKEVHMKKMIMVIAALAAVTGIVCTAVCVIQDE